MRRIWTLAAAVVGAGAAMAVPAGLASADDPRSPQEVINDLQSQGYTVNIDRTGSAPMSECVVTNVRNPKQVTQWVPYIGPGRNDGDNALVLQVVSQSISVSLDCTRR